MPQPLHPTVRSMLIPPNSTDDEVQTYIATMGLPNVSADQITALLNAYPNVAADGSPFDTGSLNEIEPEYKRVAALQGDLVFNGPRRAFLAQRSAHQNTWSFCKCPLVKHAAFFTDWAHGQFQ